MHSIHVFTLQRKTHTTSFFLLFFFFLCHIFKAVKVEVCVKLGVERDQKKDSRLDKVVKFQFRQLGCKEGWPIRPMARPENDSYLPPFLPTTFQFKGTQVSFPKHGSKIIVVKTNLKCCLVMHELHAF